MRLCKPLLDSTIGTDPWFKYVRASADALASPHATSLLLAAGYCFRTTGELREELLPLLWEPLGLHRDDYGSVLLLLCQTGVLFLAEHTEHGRRWVMPRRLPESPPEMAIERWARAADGSAKEGGAKEMLALMYDLGPSPPPGLAERLMAACYGIGQYRAFWKRGAIIETRIGRAHLLIELRAVRTRRRRPPLAASPAGNEGGGGGKRGGGKGGGDGNASGDADDEEDEGGLGYEYDYSYELAMETRGPHAMRAEIWGLLLRLRPRVEALLAEWPEVKRSPQLCCPGCLAKREPTPSRWPADAETRARAGVEVMPTCPKCESPCDLVGIQQDKAYPEEALALSMPHDVERSVPPNPAPMKFGQPVQASMSLPRLLGVDKRRLDDLMRPPEPGEEDDGEGGGGGGDPFGWTDKDWLHYLMSGPAEELRLPDGMPSEVLDRGHGGMSLEDFARLPEASRAGLDRAHILALRLATSSAFRRITGPLFVGCSDSRPHPYPATVAVLSEAITALQRGAAYAEAEEAEEHLEAAAKKLAEEEAADGGTFRVGGMPPPLLTPPPPKPELLLWRGVSNMEVTAELLERGGTLIAPTSLSTDRMRAIENACDCHSRRNPFPPCLLKIRSGGALGGEAMAAVDVRFVSLYPREAQFLLPPGVHLHCHQGEAEILEEVLESGEPGPLLVQLELVPTPLRGAWVPSEHEVHRKLQQYAENGGGVGKTSGGLTPRGLTPRGLTPRGACGGILGGGLISPRRLGGSVLGTPRGGLGTPRGGLFTPRAASPSAAEPAVGLW